MLSWSLKLHQKLFDMAVKKDIVLKQVDPSLPPLLDFHLPSHPQCHTEPHGSAQLSQAEVTRTPAPAVVQAQDALCRLGRVGILEGAQVTPTYKLKERNSRVPLDSEETSPTVPMSYCPVRCTGMGAAASLAGGCSQHHRNCTSWWRWVSF